MRWQRCWFWMQNWSKLSKTKGGNCNFASILWISSWQKMDFKWTLQTSGWWYAHNVLHPGSARKGCIKNEFSGIICLIFALRNYLCTRSGLTVAQIDGTGNIAGEFIIFSSLSRHSFLASLFQKKDVYSSEPPLWVALWRQSIGGGGFQHLSHKNTEGHYSVTKRFFPDS